MESDNEEQNPPPELGWRYLDEGNPETVGWYAIAVCWDEEEGTCVYATYWNGEDWEDSFPVNQFAGPFDTKQEAEVWGRKNDFF